MVRHYSFEHAARALPHVQRRPPTLRALGLEEPFPFRPTSDVLCRLIGTVTRGSYHRASLHAASPPARSKPRTGFATAA
jgi:hypothetical protein